MPSIASRDLRNHTATVLRQVADGAEVVVTVHGKPIALITRPRSRKQAGIPKEDFLALLDRQATDPSLADDMAWISEGSTDELGPLR